MCIPVYPWRPEWASGECLTLFRQALSRNLELGWCSAKAPVMPSYSALPSPGAKACISYT